MTSLPLPAAQSPLGRPAVFEFCTASRREHCPFVCSSSLAVVTVIVAAFAGVAAHSNKQIEPGRHKAAPEILTKARRSGFMATETRSAVERKRASPQKKKNGARGKSGRGDSAEPTKPIRKIYGSTSLPPTRANDQYLIIMVVSCLTSTPSGHAVVSVIQAKKKASALNSRPARFSMNC